MLKSTTHCSATLQWLGTRATFSIILALATLIAFLPALNCGFINYDDPGFVYENAQVASGFSVEGIRWALTATRMSNWHPLTWISHMADCQLYGLNPQGHHATSLMLHIFNTLLLFLALDRLTGIRAKSAFVAALFALHPLHVESVAWISERKDLLCALFFMLALYAYACYTSTRTVWTYLATLGAFMAGLLAKPMIVTLPVLLLILDWFPLGRFQREPVQRLLLEKVPFLAFTAVIAAITVFIQEQNGALAPLAVHPLPARLSNAVYAYGQYLFHTFMPLNLAFFYPLPKQLPQWKIAIGSIFLVTVTITVIFQSRMRPYLAAGWAWFLVGLLPVIGLFQVGSQSHADRYTYLPLIGIFIMISWGGEELFQGKHRKAMLFAATGITLTLLAVLTFRQTVLWKDSVTLYTHTLGVTGDNFTVRYNLGVELNRQGRFADAATQFREAVRIEPEFPQGHYNLASTLAKIGQTDAAIQHFGEVIRIDPGFEAAYRQLGYYHEQTGRYKPAIYYYELLLRLAPYDNETRHRVGRLKGMQSLQP